VTTDLLAGLDPDARERIGAIARGLVAVVIGGAVATIAFLVMVQGAFHKGYIDLDWTHVLGTAVKGTSEETSGSHTALSVVGDTAGPAGLWTAFLMGAVALAVFALTGARWRRGWLSQTVALWVIACLIFGLGFGLYADARLDTPTGAFGVDVGGITPLAIILSCLGFALLGVRCYRLMVDARWWAPKHEGLSEGLDEVVPVATPGSFELIEKSLEKSHVEP
jgi:hypothetical protein